MFNIGLIDSLKIRVRLDKVEIVDKRLVTEFMHYYPDISILDDDLSKAQPIVRIINGITYRFYVKSFITSQRISEEYLVFQISAKMAKSDYFSGITLKNIYNIVDDINAFNIVKIEPKQLLDGLISDIDICINQLIDMKSLQTAVSFIRQFPQPSKKPLLHFISKSSSGSELYNYGVDFNKREKATNTTPYCKIYHKGLELQSKSVEFYKAYLEPMKASVLDNLVRFEFTIKNSKHKKYLKENELIGSELKTLNDLLKYKPKELLKIAQSGLKHYIEPKKKSKTNISELTPMDVMLSYYIEELINLGYDMEKLLGFQYLLEDKPVQKSQCKTKAKKIIDNITSVDNNKKIKLQQNEISINFLKNIGYE